jgi:chromosome segregation protein
MVKKYFAEIEKTQLDPEEQTAGLRHVELELEQMRQAHYAVGDHMHQAQGHLYQTNAKSAALRRRSSS